MVKDSISLSISVKFSFFRHLSYHSASPSIRSHTIFRVQIQKSLSIIKDTFYPLKRIITEISKTKKLLQYNLQISKTSWLLHHMFVIENNEQKLIMKN